MSVLNDESHADDAGCGHHLGRVLDQVDQILRTGKEGKKLVVVSEDYFKLHCGKNIQSLQIFYEHKLSVIMAIESDF